MTATSADSDRFRHLTFIGERPAAPASTSLRPARAPARANAPTLTPASAAFFEALLEHWGLDAARYRETIFARRESACLRALRAPSPQQGQLISDLLDISRSMAGKLHLEVQPVDLRFVAESALDSVRTAAEGKRIHIEREIEEVDAEVMGDATRLEQVVWNLLSNAVKFTPTGGRVRLATARASGYIEIVVADSGEGIDPALLPHLFERYRQADASSTRRHGGLGLGLAIVKNLVALHAGTVTAHSDGLGKGSTFRVRLPPEGLARRAGQHRSHTLTELRAIDGDAGDLDGLTILVVDDEPDALDLIAHILHGRGATVKGARSGEEAVALLDSVRPDVIISDISMPEMDGYSLIKAIRRRAADSVAFIPAIALTAFARSEDRARALSAGYQFHVAKPVDATKLVATLARLRATLLVGPERVSTNGGDD